MRGNLGDVIIKGYLGSRKSERGWEPNQICRKTHFFGKCLKHLISAEGSNLGKFLFRYLLDFGSAKWGNLRGISLGRRY